MSEIISATNFAYFEGVYICQVFISSSRLLTMEINQVFHNLFSSIHKE